jgi:ABC-type polysaccharide transport system, permease component
MKQKKGLKELPLHLMMLPGVLFLIIFSYIPIGGLIIAFQRFVPAKGLFGAQKFIGFDNFRYVFSLSNFQGVLRNTIVIAFAKIIMGILVPLIVTILINELKNVMLKKGIQTAIYLPHFLSWVILGGIFIDLFSPSGGVINKIIMFFGGEAIFFLGDNKWFQPIMVITETWKSFGYGTIVYLAAVTGIDPGLYEAARVDGASRWKQILHVTLPGIRVVVVLMAVLSLGNVLNAGFDQIFNLYSPPVYETGDIIDTFVYRIGLLDAQFGVATAVGLFKSVISFAFITISYFCASKFANYKLF